jgi:lysophospholipase L1-like esterase
VLDQFSLQDVDEHNFELFYQRDKLHMNEDGYRRIVPLQVSFLAQ